MPFTLFSCRPFSHHRLWFLLGMILLMLLILSKVALAGNAGGGGLPSDEWFTKIRQSVTGPWAFTFAIVGIVGAGATLIFGGDLNGFLRSIIFLVLALSFIVTAQNTLSAITGQGADLGDVPSAEMPCPETELV